MRAWQATSQSATIRIAIGTRLGGEAVERIGLTAEIARIDHWQKCSAGVGDERVALFRWRDQYSSVKPEKGLAQSAAESEVLGAHQPGKSLLLFREGGNAVLRLVTGFNEQPAMIGSSLKQTD